MTIPRSLLRRLENQLIRHPTISHVSSDSTHLSIKFVTGIVRNFIWNVQNKHLYLPVIISDRDLVKFEPIKIGYQFPWTSINRPDLAKYWFVPRTSLYGRTIIEKEVLAHDILYRIETEGVPPNYWSEEQIKNDLDIINTSWECGRKTFITPYPRASRNKRVMIGQPIIETYNQFYFDNYFRPKRSFKLRKYFRNRRCMYALLLHLIFKSSADVNVFNVRFLVEQKGIGPLMPNPIVYKAILRHFFGKDVHKREIFDFDPGLGHKALAMAALGCKYHYGGFLPTALLDYCGVNYQRCYFDDPSFDILMVDEHFNPCNVRKKIPLIQKSNNTIMYCSTDKMTSYVEGLFKVKGKCQVLMDDDVKIVLCLSPK